MTANYLPPSTIRITVSLIDGRTDVPIWSDVFNHVMDPTSVFAVQAEIADLRDKLRAAGDVLERTEVVAPLSGTVVDLKVHTLGGVVQPGQDADLALKACQVLGRIRLFFRKNL